MEEDKNQSVIPVIILLIVAACLILIPLRVLGYGFLPQDDALRHGAKAVSGKAWSEILVLREEVKFDNHPGWQVILGFIHRLTACGPEGLAVFSVAVLSLSFILLPLFFLYRPEAWLATLLIFIVAGQWISRIFLGRPYLVTMSCMLAICFLWSRLKDEKIHYPVFITIMLLTAFSTWVHGGWYLFCLPIAAFFLAREWRAGVRVTCAIILGVLFGASITLHPCLFLKQGILHFILAFGDKSLERMLVGEFRPSAGDALIIAAILFMLVWRYIKGEWNKKVIDNPVFILVVLGWILGFAVQRFWLDWGMVALSSWMACELQERLEGTLDIRSLRALVITGALAFTLYLAITADIGGRWTYNLTKEYLLADDPKQAPWLPEKGGIFYNDDMTIFYDTFFKNPHAPWRYILGFEPALMPPEDLAIYRKIQWNYYAYQAYEPWVKKMRPQDRLIIRRPAEQEPKIKGLEWHYAATGIWSGRLPRKKE